MQNETFYLRGEHYLSLNFYAETKIFKNFIFGNNRLGWK